MQTVGSTGLPSITLFTAVPVSISAGDQVVLSWSVSGATAVTIDQGVGAVATTGDRTVMPAMTTTYTLTAVNAAGANSAKVTVTVAGTSAADIIPPPGPPYIQYFTVTPESIAPGGTAVLSWSVLGALSVTVDNGIGSVTSVNTRSVSPGSTTTYTLSANNPAGTSLGYAVLTIASPVSPPANGSSVEKKWIGSTYTREYHYLDCSIARKIPFPSKIWFDTVAQAQAEGYHACPVCKPPQ
ncbi:MAG: hypothetical protein PHG36_01355 [Dehalococcoidia bacterium]|nr:hypothetical protein [Dehalococcoidia bacterium]